MHTNKILQSIDRLSESAFTDLFIFSDSPKNEKDAERVNEVRRLLHNFKCNSHFAKVTIVESQANKGLANSIIYGVTEVISKYEKVIVLEDDLLVAPDFLHYMNGALDFYKGNKRIWSVSAYTFNMKSLESYTKDIYVTGRGCSWGWGTWSDRWNKVDWSVSDYSSFKFNFSKRREFGLDGRDMPLMLDAYIYGEVRSWAIRWCYSAFKNKMLTVYPKRSRILNIGTDGSGTNFTSINKSYDTTLNTDFSECVFENVEIDNRIRKEFRNRFMNGELLLKARVRWFLIKIGLLKSKK